MCKADVSLLTFDWVPNDRAPRPDFDVEHECKNWDRIDAWAQEHRFDIFDERTLVHPTLGMLGKNSTSCPHSRRCIYCIADARDVLGPSFPEKEYKDTGRIPGHPGFLHGHGEAGNHAQTGAPEIEEEYGKSEKK